MRRSGFCRVGRVFEIHRAQSGGSSLRDPPYTLGKRRREVPQVTVPPELSAWLAARVAAFPSEAPEGLRWEAPYVAESGALPLYCEWTETIAIRPDGEFVRWSTEGEYAGVKPVEERYLWVSALVIACRRYSELHVLLPARPPGAVDCDHFGHPLFTEYKVICSKCCGLGWLVGGESDQTAALVENGPAEKSVPG